MRARLAVLAPLAVSLPLLLLASGGSAASRSPVVVWKAQMPGYPSQPPADEEAAQGQEEPAPEGQRQPAPDAGCEALLGAMQQAEEERYLRIEGYAGLIEQLVETQEQVAYGEWQVEPAIEASEELLGYYAEIAASQNAWLELEQIEGALDRLGRLRERLENRDLYIARIELTFAIEYLYRARRAAMSVTSPAGPLLGGQYPPPVRPQPAPSTY